MIKSNNIHIHEIKKFSDTAYEWWNEGGPYKSLHKLNILRLSYIKELLIQHFHRTQETLPLKDLEILDIGCGGGLVSEPICRLGAQVTAIDPSPENITIAKEHAQHFGLNIFYSSCTLEELNDHKTYDVVLALEVLEHLPNPEAFLAACFEKTTPGGLCIVATLNRTLRSYLEGIVAAEHILKWVPKGTHSWSQFLKPSELYHLLDKAGFQKIAFQGISFSSLKNEWTLSDSLEINYMASATK